MDSLSLISQFLPIIFLVALGALLGKQGFLTGPMIEGLKRIVSSISLPALLFLAFSRVSVEGRLGFLAVAVFISCALLGFTALLPVKLFSLPKGSTVLLFQGFEAGMLGYALFTSFYGKSALPAFASADLGQVIYVFTVLMFQLQRVDSIAAGQEWSGDKGQTKGKQGPPGSRSQPDGQEIPKGKVQELRAILIGLLSSPVILAIISGLLASIWFPGARGTPWDEGGFLYPLLSTVGSVTTPLVSLVVGFGLKDLSLANVTKSLLLILSRLVAVILFALGIIKLLLPALGYGFMQALAVISLFILPPPFIIPVFKKGDEDRALISTVLSLHTLVAIVLAFGIALIWGNRQLGSP
jgi:hypothetical protein